MNALTFDTLQFANRLKAVGVPSAHAEAGALAEVFVSQWTGIATKPNLDRLEHEMKSKMASKQDLEHELGHLQQDVARLESRTQEKMDRLEERLEAKIATSALRLHGEMLALSRQMGLLRWMMGLMVAGLASLILKAFALPLA